MFDIAALRNRLTDESPWVVFSTSGEALDINVSPGSGMATLLVEPVTEALKIVDVDARVIGSVDRDDVHAVGAYALHRSIMERLEGIQLDQAGLFDAVKAAGASWETRSMTEVGLDE